MPEYQHISTEVPKTEHHEPELLNKNIPKTNHHNNTERICLWIICFLYAGVLLNNVHNQVFQGQDWISHHKFTLQLVNDLENAFRTDLTNPPMLYLIGAAFHGFTHGKYFAEMTALFFVALNLVALVLYHRICKFLIRSWGMRLAALTFFAFLPVTIITTSVYASDALTLLPFACFLLLLIKLPGFQSISKFLLASAAISGVIILANVTKYTFIALVPVAFVVLLLYFHWRMISLKRFLVSFTLIVLLPGLFAGTIRWQHSKHDKTNKISLKLTGEMTLRSLLMVKKTDVEIFSAPPFGEKVTVNGVPQYRFLVNNAHSYPALLHLSVFTDYGNMANAGLIDGYGKRTPEVQERMRLSVKTAIIFSLIGLLSVIIVGIRCLSEFIRGRDGKLAQVFVIFLSSCAMFFVVVGFFPFIHNVYKLGYWGPRLIFPSFFGFTIILFYFLDRVLCKVGPWARWSLYLMVVFQSSLHLSFLWF